MEIENKQVLRAFGGTARRPDLLLPAKQKGETMEMDYEQAVRTFGGTVYRIAYSQCPSREDADDVFQETFLKLLESRKSFESPEHLKAWLIRVAVNFCKQLKRSFRYRNTDELNENIPAPSAGEEFDPVPVIKAVKALPDKYRTVILLFYYEDMSCGEIAEALGRNEATVRTQLSRARALLKDMLKEDYHYE